MEFDFEKTQRTVWEVSDRFTFFEKMRALLNIDHDTADAIAEHLNDRDFDYVEVASYLLNAGQEDPDAVLVFDGKKDVYWDIFNINKSKQIMALITKTAGESAKMTHQRGLTQRDWRKRLQALGDL